VLRGRKGGHYQDARFRVSPEVMIEGDQLPRERRPPLAVTTEKRGAVTGGPRGAK